MSDWRCVDTALHESDTLCFNNPVQLCSASADGAKMDPIQSVPFCFTCKHRDPTWNAPKPRFDNRMASMQISLIDCLAKKTINMEIILAWNSVTGLFFRLRVNTHTANHFIQKSDPAWNDIVYTYLSILLATFNYRVHGTCVPTRAFHRRFAR